MDAEGAVGCQEPRATNLQLSCPRSGFASAECFINLDGRNPVSAPSWQKFCYVHSYFQTGASIVCSTTQQLPAAARIVEGPTVLVPQQAGQGIRRQLQKVPPSRSSYPCRSTCRSGGSARDSRQQCGLRIFFAVGTFSCRGHAVTTGSRDGQ